MQKPAWCLRRLVNSVSPHVFSPHWAAGQCYQRETSPAQSNQDWEGRHYTAQPDDISPCGRNGTSCAFHLLAGLLFSVGQRNEQSNVSIPTGDHVAIPANVHSGRLALSIMMAAYSSRDFASLACLCTYRVAGLRVTDRDWLLCIVGSEDMADKVTFLAGSRVVSRATSALPTQSISYQ